MAMPVSRRLFLLRTRSPARFPCSSVVCALPPSISPSSHIFIATGHIRYLETVKDQLEMRLKSAEAEVHRLRNVNEALMLGAASQRAQGAF